MFKLHCTRVFGQLFAFHLCTKFQNNLKYVLYYVEDRLSFPSEKTPFYFVNKTIRAFCEYKAFQKIKYRIKKQLKPYSSEIEIKKKRPD